MSAAKFTTPLPQIGPRAVTYRLQLANYSLYSVHKKVLVLNGWSEELIVPDCAMKKRVIYKEVVVLFAV